MSLPNKMNAIEINGDKSMSIAKSEIPKPESGQVLIKCHYSGINRPDLLQRKGLYPPPINASPILGLEASGEIVALGKRAGPWQIGDKVCALLNGGGYAEYVIAEAGHCLKVPNKMDMKGAACLPETMLTVYTNVFEDCALSSGETFLIHGGASGIGVSAIQMAKAIGAKVVATVGSEEKREFCLRLGADLVINYKTQDFEDVIRGIGGVDVILDMVGGNYIQKNINILKDLGRLSFIAFLQGPQANVNFMRLMLKRIKVTGSTLRSRTNEEKSRIVSALQRDFGEYLDSGAIRPIIHGVYELKDANKAHEILEANQNMGKLLFDHKV